MTTLSRLLADGEFNLRPVNPEWAEIYSARRVTGLWPAGVTPPPSGWCNVLAVLGEKTDPATYETLVRSAAEGGAAGIAAVEPVTGDLVEIGHRHEIPVLLTTEDQPWLRLAHRLAELRHREEREEARNVQQLLKHARQLGSDHHTADGVLRWLALTIDGAALLIDPHQPTEKLDGSLKVPADRLAALIASPRPAADAYQTDAWAVRMSTVGPSAPRHVLFTAQRGSSWDPTANESVRLTAEILDWWLRMRGGNETLHEHVRESLLQLLMSGQVLAAQRMAHPLAIGKRLMDAEAARVYVANGPTARRHLLAAALHHSLGSEAVVVRCPVARRQTVVLATDVKETDAAIRKVLRDFPEVCVGVSRSAPLSDIATSHGEATRALGPAEMATDRYAVYTAEIDIAQVLPRDAAWRWAWNLLRPIAPSQTWSMARREEWLWTMNLWLAFGTRGTVNITGSHRNTPRRRAAALSQLLGLDLENSLADRIKLDLAMRIDRLHSCTPPPPGKVPDKWLDLLAGEEVRAWGADLIARVDPALLETLVTWIACGQHRGSTAAALGIAPRTLPNRLARAEAQIRRPLISGPAPGKRPGSANGVSGVHDLALALYATGRGAGIGLDAAGGGPVAEAEDEPDEDRRQSAGADL